MLFCVNLDVYLYTEASGQSVGAVARLVTPDLGAGAKCVRLERHMYGQHIGTLRVIGRQGNSENTYAEFTKEGDPSRWKLLVCVNQK